MYQSISKKSKKTKPNVREGKNISGFFRATGIKRQAKCRGQIPLCTEKDMERKRGPEPEERVFSEEGTCYCY